MKRMAALWAVAVATVALALDLEAVQRNSARGRYLNSELPSYEVEKRRYPNMFDAKHEPSSRMSDAQYYRRMQELFANMVAPSQDARNGPMADPVGWSDVLRQRDARLTQMADIRPPYDQDDFPSYGSASGRQEETLGHWTLPSPPPPSTGRASSPSGRQQTSLEKRLGLEGRQNIYRSHKQLPFSLRVPQEELLRKRSIEGSMATKPKTLKEDVLIKDLKKPAMDKRNKRTVATATVPSTSVANASKMAATESGHNKKMSPEDFKEWLTDEYYRNMAMSFATMRKRRSVPDQGATFEGSQPEVAPEGDNAAFEHLRLMEQSLLQEALQLMQSGNVQGAKNRQHLKTQVSERLDVAHDIENLNKALQKLYADSQRLRSLDEAQLMAALRERNPSSEARERPTSTVNNNPSLNNDDCSELTVLSSGCSALQGMFPPAAVQEQFLLSCNWHEVCYACGAQHDMSADQCDQQFLSDMKSVCSRLGSCNKQMVALLLEPLHKKRIYYKRSSLPVCERACVASFLARN